MNKSEFIVPDGYSVTLDVMSQLVLVSNGKATAKIAKEAATQSVVLKACEDIAKGLYDTGERFINWDERAIDNQLREKPSATRKFKHSKPSRDTSADTVAITTAIGAGFMAGIV